MANMAAENLTVLCVWTFAKHEFGYSLKLFWKFKHDDRSSLTKLLCKDVN